MPTACPRARANVRAGRSHGVKASPARSGEIDSKNAQLMSAFVGKSVRQSQRIDAFARERHTPRDGRRRRAGGHAGRGQRPPIARCGSWLTLRKNARVHGGARTARCHRERARGTGAYGSVSRLRARWFERYIGGAQSGQSTAFSAAAVAGERPRMRKRC